MSVIEEVKKAIPHLCSRWRVQNNKYDYLTDYIYDTYTFNELIEKTRHISNIERVSYEELFCYAINRWFNNIISHSAEDEFCRYEWVEHNPNAKDKYSDFNIRWIKFDLKMSVFPKWYRHTIDEAMADPQSLIDWLYENASRQRRYHNKNKIFIVCYSEDGNHNKVKWDLEKVYAWIKEFMENYSEDKLYNENWSKVGIIFIR